MESTALVASWDVREAVSCLEGEIFVDLHDDRLSRNQMLCGGRVHSTAANAL